MDRGDAALAAVVPAVFFSWGDAVDFIIMAFGSIVCVILTGNLVGGSHVNLSFMAVFLMLLAR
jgi:hypothetical protein